MNPLIHEQLKSTFSGHQTTTESNTASSSTTLTSSPLIALIIDTIHYSTIPSDHSLKDASNISLNQQPFIPNHSLTQSNHQQHSSSTQVYFILFDSTNRTIHSHREYPIASRSLIDINTPNSINHDDFSEIIQEIFTILTRKVATTNQSLIIFASSNLHPFLALKTLPCLSILHDLEQLIFPHADILFKNPMNFQETIPSSSQISASSCVLSPSNQLRTLMHFTSDIPIKISQLFLSSKILWHTNHNQLKEHHNSHYQIIKSAIVDELQLFTKNINANKDLTKIIPCLETSQNSCQAGINICCLSTDTDTPSNDIVGDTAESAQILEELQEVDEDRIKETKEQKDKSQEHMEENEMKYEKSIDHEIQLSQEKQNNLDTLEKAIVSKQNILESSKSINQKSKRISLSVRSRPFIQASSQDNQDISCSSSKDDPQKQLNKYDKKTPQIQQTQLKNDLLLRQHFSIEQLQKVADVKSFIAIRHKTNQGKNQGLFGSSDLFQTYMHGSIISSIKREEEYINGNIVSSVVKDHQQSRSCNKKTPQQLIGQDCQRQSRSKSQRKKSITEIVGRTSSKGIGDKQNQRTVWRRADTVEQTK